jgi:hypothetical protein
MKNPLRTLLLLIVVLNTRLSSSFLITLRKQTAIVFLSKSLENQFATHSIGKAS